MICAACCAYFKADDDLTFTFELIITRLKGLREKVVHWTVGLSSCIIHGIFGDTRMDGETTA